METYILPTHPEHPQILTPQPNPHTHSYILVGSTIISLLLGLVIGFILGNHNSAAQRWVADSPAPIAAASTESKNTFCTGETKLCANGTTVGRVGPTCDFAVCPDEAASSPSAQTAGSCFNQALNITLTLPANDASWQCESDQTELLVSSTSGVNLLFSNQPIPDACDSGSTCTVQPFFEGNGLTLNTYREENTIKQIYGSFTDGTWAMATWLNMDKQPLSTTQITQLNGILATIRKGATASATLTPIQ